MKSKKGQDLAEWGVVVALVSVVTMVTLFRFAPDMKNLLDYITKSLNTVEQQQQ